VQDEVNQEESEHNEVDGMKKGADSMTKQATCPQVRQQLSQLMRQHA